MPVIHLCEHSRAQKSMPGSLLAGTSCPPSPSARQEPPGRCTWQGGHFCQGFGLPCRLPALECWLCFSQPRQHRLDKTDAQNNPIRSGLKGCCYFNPRHLFF